MSDTAVIDITWRSALMFAICVPVLMSAVLLMAQKTEQLAAIYLGLFLLVAVIKVTPQIIGFANFYSVWPGLTFAPFNIELFFGPLLLLHANSLMNGQTNSHQKWLLLPGLLQLSYYLWAFLLLGGYRNKWAYNNSFHEPFVVPVEAVVGVGLFIFCWLKVYRLSRQYEKYLEHHQSAAFDFNPVWINRLLIASMALLVLFIILQLVPVLVTDISYVEAYPLIVVMMVILAWIAVDALRKLNTPFPKINIRPSQSNDEDPTKSWDAQAHGLQQQMSLHQWYLSPRLSLRDLAEHLGSNETYVSRTINHGLGMSFNQYVNDLRIRNAQNLLQQPGATVLNSALNSGFNSKATFNRVFKQQLGITPSHYKKSYKTSQNT